MTHEDETREGVRRAYADAVTATGKGESCCGPAHKGTAVKVAGYTKEELGALPEEAVVNAFGCGNPLAFSEVREGDLVLDLGSGAGMDLLLASRRVGPAGRAIGIDMTDEMLAKAREVIQEAGCENVELRKGLIEALPVADASVDWVISNCVINLSPERHRVFAEIARVLKPGGRMLVSDIVAHDLPRTVRASSKLYRSCLKGAISEEEYLAGLSAVGLEDVHVRERIVYDGRQLAALLFASDREAIPAPLTQAVASCVGKVWSARIHARKPGGGA